MAQNIISERWIWVQQDSVHSPYIQDGQFMSPQIYYNSARLSADGCSIPTLVTGAPGTAHNAFQAADSVLIRRIRIWSPGVAVGLCGAGLADAGSELNLFAARGGVATAKAVVIRDSLALGEWVDVNESLDSSGLSGSSNDPWQLAPHFVTPMWLDSSRVAPAYIGNAFLKFQVQVDLAHTLPGVNVEYP